MAYIQREDGERFVIPSYRDVIAKRKSQLKDDLLDLCSKYGEYLTLQRRGLAQFEVAFSSDSGYLFGECVWSYFKNPENLIYCEAVHDAAEAYLVIVKDGSIYLDGVFPLENIAEELLVFTTQTNVFDIYTYGEVPLSQEAEEGKFSFDPALVKSFTILDDPLFERLPTVKAYKLQLVDVVLRKQGIGVFPVKYVITALVLIGLAWMGYSYVNMQRKHLPKLTLGLPPPTNPYLNFNRALGSPSPDAEIRTVMAAIARILTVPGWEIMHLEYETGTISFTVHSLGANAGILMTWAEQNKVKVKLTSKGFLLSLPVNLPPPRNLPARIYPLSLVVSSLIDRVSLVLPDSMLHIGPPTNRRAYEEASIAIGLSDVSPEMVIILSEQLRGLPLVLTNMSFKLNHGLTGTIVLQALGS